LPSQCDAYALADSILKKGQTLRQTPDHNLQGHPAAADGTFLRMCALYVASAQINLDAIATSVNRNPALFPRILEIWGKFDGKRDKRCLCKCRQI
jgi:hypothetical protein